MRTGYVYILTNKPNGVLFTGVTSDLIRRVHEHKEKATAGYTREYNLDRLAYYEVYDSLADAIAREKKVRESSRTWKLAQILKMNPDWRDLYEDITATPTPVAC